MKHVTTILAFVAALTLSSWSKAGGLEVAEQGAAASGRGGAFTAKADDLTAMEYNPAALSTARGTAVYVSNRFGYADERFKRAATLDWTNMSSGDPARVSFDEVKNGRPWQLLAPFIAFGTDFGRDDMALALGVSAPGGIGNQSYPDDGGQRYMLLTRNVRILYYNLSFAWKYRDTFGIGATFRWVDADKLKFSLVVDGNPHAARVNPVSSLYDMKATIEAADHLGATAIVGAWFKPIPCLQLGLSGQVIPVKIDAKGSLKVESLNMLSPNLTRGGKDDDRVNFSMTLPMLFKAGVRYIHLEGDREQFDLELDVRYELWSQMDKYAIDAEGLVAHQGAQSYDIGTIEIPKNWRNTTSIHLGGDYTLVHDHLVLRGGAFFESAAATSSHAYVDFPASARLGGSLGATVKFKGATVGLAYTYVRNVTTETTEEDSEIFQQTPASPCAPPYNDPLSCDQHYQGQPAAAANAGRHTAQYHFWSLSLGYVF